MDLEHLNKNQVILLALLVSFVTSIATGIVTVSLVNQAPPQVEATVNHIIEHTIEQVSPASQPASPASTVKTVVVQNDDLAAQSIAKVRQSIIRIVAAASPDLLVARGLIIDAKGIAITDNNSLDPNTSYKAILPDGTLVPLTVRPAATTTSVALLDLKISTTTTLSAATFGDSSKLQLGQTVIRIGGAGGDTVGEGVIASLPKSDSNDVNTPQVLEATVTSTTPGSILVTFFGEVIGMVTTNSQQQGSDFYSIPSIFKVAASAAEASSTAAGSGSAARGSSGH